MKLRRRAQSYGGRVCRDCGHIQDQPMVNVTHISGSQRSRMADGRRLFDITSPTRYLKVVAPGGSQEAVLTIWNGHLFNFFLTLHGALVVCIIPRNCVRIKELVFCSLDVLISFILIVKYHDKRIVGTHSIGRRLAFRIAWYGMVWPAMVRPGRDSMLAPSKTSSTSFSEASLDIHRAYL